MGPLEAQRWLLGAVLVFVAGSLSLMAAISYASFWLAVAAAAGLGLYGLAMRIRYRQYTDLYDERLIRPLRDRMQDAGEL